MAMISVYMMNRQQLRGKIGGTGGATNADPVPDHYPVVGGDTAMANSQSIPSAEVLAAMRPIPGFDGYFATPSGEIVSARGSEPRFLRSSACARYRTVVAYAEGRQRTIGVHRAVLLAFIGPPPEGCEARHLNGDAFDNRIENLAWGTKSENARDRLRHGTDKAAENGRRTTAKRAESNKKRNPERRCIRGHLRVDLLKNGTCRECNRERLQRQRDGQRH
jgi:hypothetical protein